jgi:hypothetical protein
MLKLNKATITTALILGVVMQPALAWAGDVKPSRFEAAASFGASRQSLVALLGEPATDICSSIAFVKTCRMSWSSLLANQTYRVTLINDRLIGYRICVRSNIFFDQGVCNGNQ